MQRKNGFTLVEMMIVVVLIGAVTLIGWPKVASGLAKNNLRSSRTTLANMFTKARAFAVQSNPAHVHQLIGNNWSSPRRRGSRPAAAVPWTRSARSRSCPSLRRQPDPAEWRHRDAYDPRGFARLTSSRTFFVARNSKTDSVTVDGLQEAHQVNRIFGRTGAGSPWSRSWSRSWC